jgi:TolB-like protein
VAVIPFTNLLADSEFKGIGDLLADGIIDSLSMSPGLRVVCRVFPAAHSRRGLRPLAEIANRLDVRYVVSGTYAVSGSNVTVSAELADASGGHILWSGRMGGKWRELLAPECQLTHEPR